MSLKPVTTLFMLISVDGKISTGDLDLLDFDQDLPKIKGVKEGLHQYYDLEKKTDYYSLNSGRVQEKMGVNKKKEAVTKIPVNFIVIDNKPHLNAVGVNYFLKRGKKLFLITTNKNHPAFKIKEKENLEIIFYAKKINFHDLFLKFKQKFKIPRITIQTGGELNSEFLRSGLIDRLSLVVAPVLVGGNTTASLVGGKSLHTIKELSNIRALKLKKCTVLKNSYLHLQYDVLNN
jgi:2,5-diamino-6-(ribosylamino)-4(3H)-pyrimidinone 5'-phosphate reductase